LPYYVGAYASSPNTANWDSVLESRYYQQLKALDAVKGLEHPFLGNLHPYDDDWFIANIDRKWRFVFTCIPGIMSAIGNNPKFGLASNDNPGRQEALVFMAKARTAIAKLNAAYGYSVVDAIQVQTSPSRAVASSSPEALKLSLETMLQWDWQGARIVIEHCDAFIVGQKPSKGFLTLSEEIAVLEAINSQRASSLGIVINWGRSAIEARNSQGAIDHIIQAKENGLLIGLMFSGACDQTTTTGPWQEEAWKDSHRPPALSTTTLGAIASLMTAEKMHACMLAADYKNLPILGIKIGIRPIDAPLEERLSIIRDSLAILDAAPKC
jgi:hypothetical protein